MLRKACDIVALSTALWVCGLQGVAAQELQPGERLADSLLPGQQRSWQVQLPVGTLLQGDFDGQGVHLDLQDAQGRHLRRLAQADGTRQSWLWQVGPTGQERLVATLADGQQAGRWQLQLGKSWRSLPPQAPARASELASPRLQALQAQLAQGVGTEAAVGAFWQQVQAEGTPLIEALPGGESLVTFLWRGARDNVRLFGSPSGNHEPLQRLGSSDVWWASFRMPDTARLSYLLAPDVPRIDGTAMEQRRAILATAQRDPLNTRRFPEGDVAPVDAFQGRSVLRLPQAPAQPWVAARATVPPGRLVHQRLHSSVLGNDRDVWTYVPAGAAPQALLVLFDAHAYVADVPTPRIVDNLLADGLIPPTAVILVGNASPELRGRELPPNAAFARFLGEELMPWVQAQGLGQPAPRTVIAGSSYGGLASAYAGLVNANWFGNVLSLSGSYWWSPPGEIPGWVQRQYAQAPRQAVQFYLDAGRYETARGGQDGILETNRHLADVLRAKGYRVTQAEYDTGHDYLHWQGALGCGLVALLNPGRYAQGLPGCTARYQRGPDADAGSPGR